MIRSISGDGSAAAAFCRRDVFGTRIAAYLGCYGDGYDFVKFWVQYRGEKLTAVIGRIDGDATLCAGDEADFDELAYFLRLTGFSTLQCESRALEKLGFAPSAHGNVVRAVRLRETNARLQLKNSFEPKEIYDIICAAGLVGEGGYLPWLSDYTMRLRAGCTEALLAVCEGRNASCAMSLFETETAVLLGGVATLPEFRGRGLAGGLVTRLAAQGLARGKRTELLCRADSITGFYKGLGFEVVNEWSVTANETGNI